MRRLITAAAIVAGLSTAACESPQDAPTPSSSSTSSSSTTTTSSSSVSTSTSPTTETSPEYVDEPPQEAVATEPTVIACEADPPGPALYSDGKVLFSQNCYDKIVATRPPYRCPGTDSYVSDSSKCHPIPTPSPDPATIPYADGGTCPAYKCGYGHDANGNPNPSSGELQAQYGCQQGYITDPELCAAVANK